MGLAGVLSVFVVKRHEKPWEVVDSKTVEPVALFDEEDGAFRYNLGHGRHLIPVPQISTSYTFMRRGSFAVSYLMYGEIRI
jgi:hypothetical protein